jgi:excisionase family DNA binding protein
MPDEILCGLAAIGRAYGISEATAHKLCHSGEIPATRIGAQWRLKRSIAEQHFDRPINADKERANAA